MGFDYEDCLYCYIKCIPRLAHEEHLICLACMHILQKEEKLNDRMKDALERYFGICTDTCVSCLQKTSMGFHMSVCAGCVEEFKAEAIPLPEKPE